MTRVALLGPPHAGLEWWGIVETGFTRHEGPKHPALVIPVPYQQTWDDADPEPISKALVEHIEVRFHPLKFMSERPNRQSWTAVVDGNMEATRLLNIAYTCPDTHVHWAEASYLRRHFEKIMERFGG